MRRLALIALVAMLAFAAIATAAEKSKEPFFPRSGNAGYKVDEYEARLGYQPRTGFLNAQVWIGARSTQRLSRFSLDLNGLHVTEVEVDGEPARFNRGRGKLKVTPRTPIEDHAEFAVFVRYQGKPQKVIDPDGGEEGWIRTDDGALAVGEPVGTAAWLPCNNVPNDKASFEITISVPRGLEAVSNGRLALVEREGDRRIFTWVENEPMSPYLALVDIGRGQLVKTRPDGLPTWTLVDPRQARASRKVLAQLPEIIRFESSIYGDYPFDWAGSVVDLAPKLGYALETQTRPIYAFVPDLTTVVHETAHQWFGDSVGLQRWPNIWLNEGFATWTEWYYAERHGGRTARQIFRRLYRVPATQTDFWDPPSGHPGTPNNLFATSTYVRGGMTLEALRAEIGTQKLLQLLRRWAAGHAYASADIKQFIQLAEEVSGRDLGRFFHRWLYQRGKPPGYGSL
ncbi:MAG TPA: M1 family metallopeptidase [Solirubrobacterales bacterium]|nr:M1 family metallopeptidase [Solirubrobacterales bacterium]